MHKTRDTLSRTPHDLALEDPRGDVLADVLGTSLLRNAMYRRFEEGAPGGKVVAGPDPPTFCAGGRGGGGARPPDVLRGGAGQRAGRGRGRAGVRAVGR